MILRSYQLTASHQSKIINSMCLSFDFPKGNSHSIIGYPMTAEVSDFYNRIENLLRGWLLMTGFV